MDEKHDRFIKRYAFKLSDSDLAEKFNTAFNADLTPADIHKHRFAQGYVTPDEQAGINTNRGRKRILGLVLAISLAGIIGASLASRDQQCQTPEKSGLASKLTYPSYGTPLIELFSTKRNATLEEIAEFRKLCLKDGVDPTIVNNTHNHMVARSQRVSFFKDPKFREAYVNEALARSKTYNAEFSKYGLPIVPLKIHLPQKASDVVRIRYNPKQFDVYLFAAHHDVTTTSATGPNGESVRGDAHSREFARLECNIYGEIPAAVNIARETGVLAARNALAPKQALNELQKPVVALFYSALVKAKMSDKAIELNPLLEMRDFTRGPYCVAEQDIASIRILVKHGQIHAGQLVRPTVNPYTHLTVAASFIHYGQARESTLWDC